MKLWQIENLALHEHLSVDPEKNLKYYSVESLRVIAERISLKALKKVEIVDGIVKKLKNKRSLDKIISSFDEMDLALLKLVSKSSLSNRTVCKISRQASLCGISDSFERLYRLVQHGLVLINWYKNTSEVFRLEDYEKGNRLLCVFVADSVIKAVNDVEPYKISFEAAFPARTLSGLHQDPSMLLHEYDVLMKYLYHQPVEFIKSGRIKAIYVKRSLKRIGQIISTIDEKRFEYMVMLLESGGLILRNEETKRVALSKTGEAWFELGPLERLKQIYKASTKHTFDFLSLDYYSKVHDDIFTSPTNNRVQAGGRLDVGADWNCLPDVLSIVPQDNFVKLSEVIGLAGQGYPYLFFSFYDELNTNVSNPPVLSLEQRRIQKVVFTGYIEEIATPMGLIEWAIGKKSGELLIRLTALGAFFLDMEDESQLDYSAKTSHGPAIVIQPDFDVLVFLDKVSLHESVSLLDICAVTDEQMVQSPVRRLRLCKESIKWAIENKIDKSEILELINRLSFDSVPQNVKVELEEWTGGSYPVELYRGHDLLEFNTELERDSMQRKISNAIAVSTRFLLVLESSQPDKELVDYESVPPKELKILPDGSITRNISGPKSLETGKVLESVAVQTAENIWSLDSVKLTQSGLTSRKIIEFLEEASESLPPAVYATITGACTEKIEVKTGRMEIVEISDRRLLKGLMEHESTKETIAGNIGATHIAIHQESSKKFWSSAKKIGLKKSLEPLVNLPKTTGRLSADKKVGDLSGFNMVKGSERRQQLVNAINNGWDVELLILESSLSYYYSRSKIDIVKGSPLGFEGDNENYLRLKTEKTGHVSIIKLQTIKAIRDLL